jgi:hypothetical protein
MNIVDRFIGIWVTHKEIKEILGFEPPSQEPMFMLGGKVLGESPVGLWIMLETISAGLPPENVFPDLQKEKPRRFVRWEYVRAAEVFEEKPDMQQPVGLQRHAA